MLIIAGWLSVDPGERDSFVERHQDVVRRARLAPGCMDLAISPDRVDPGRVNMYELWESEEMLAAWQAVARVPRPMPPILGGDVKKYEVTSIRSIR